MLLAFKELFVGRIRQMRASIRKERKDHYRPRPGETLICYAGVRTEFVRKLGTAVCQECQSVSISERGFFINGIELTQDDLESLAPMLGFDTWAKCQEYWLRWQRLPFHGWIVFWRDFQ